MSTLLLIIIFTAYVGLGVPDSLFGSAWPAISETFGISQSSAWVISTPISCATLISSLLSAKLIEKFGTKSVVIISTFLTAIALFCSSFSKTTLTFILWGIPLGFGGGAIDSALNTYVALHYKASQMNYLHCFYGVGVAVSPYVMSLALTFTTWQNGYRYASIIQFTIAFLTLLSIPLWKIHQSPTKQLQSDNQENYGSYKSLFKHKMLLPVCLIFLLACTIEVGAGTYATTYMVSVKGATKSQGALFLTFYYVGLALGRILSGILSSKFSPNAINVMGMCTIGCGIAILFIPTNFLAVCILGLFLVGLGVGPIYPNMSFLTPQHFGENGSQKAMGLQMAGAFIGVLVAPSLIGVLSAYFSLKIFPLFILVALGLLAISYYSYLRIYKKYGKI